MIKDSLERKMVMNKVIDGVIINMTTKMIVTVGKYKELCQVLNDNRQLENVRVYKIDSSYANDDVIGTALRSFKSSERDNKILADFIISHGGLLSTTSKITESEQSTDIFL